MLREEVAQLMAWRLRAIEAGNGSNGLGVGAERLLRSTLAIMAGLASNGVTTPPRASSATRAKLARYLPAPRAIMQQYAEVCRRRRRRRLMPARLGFNHRRAAIGGLKYLARPRIVKKIIASGIKRGVCRAK